VETPLKETISASPLSHQSCLTPLAILAVTLAAALAPALLGAQATTTTTTAAPPPSSGGVFPVSQVKAGMKATAWTVFKGNDPEPMDVEILGVMRNARGPGQDIVLAQLLGAKPEYTGVVAGMSGSPVYIGDKLLGSLSFRIGQFTKDPIAGITPIKQMLEVRDIPIGIEEADAEGSGGFNPRIMPTEPTRALAPEGMQAGGYSEASLRSPASQTIQPMETPLVMSGFGPEAIRLWQQRMTGTGLEMVMAGGMSAPSGAGSDAISPSTGIVPGSAVSAQFVRGDMEIAATCTVTYIDSKQLLACGHPILQAGPVSRSSTPGTPSAPLPRTGNRPSAASSASRPA
jgi:hypothetical protein